MQRQNDSSFPSVEQFPVRAQPPIIAPTGYMVQASDKPADPKYVGLIWALSCAPFILIAWGLKDMMQLERAWTVLVLGLAIGLGTYVTVLVAGGQWGITMAVRNERRVRERMILYQERVQVEQIRATRAVHEAQIEAERQAKQYQVDAQIQARLAVQEQVAQASVQQSHSSLLDNYVDAEPYEDVLRKELLVYLTGLYDGTQGVPAMENGRIVGGVPWGKNSSVWIPTDKARAWDMIQQAGRQGYGWLVKYDEARRGYYVNVERFNTPGKLVRVFDAVKTPRG